MSDYTFNLLICVVFLIMALVTTWIVFAARSFTTGDNKRALTVALEFSLLAIVFDLYWLVTTIQAHFK